MKFCRRKSHFVNRDIQGALIWRIAAYWVFGLVNVLAIVVGIPVFAVALTSDSPRISGDIVRNLHHFWPVLAAAAMALAAMVVDCVRWSHRVAGPLVRLQIELRRLADGEPTAPLYFREGDYWSELATQFNRVADRLNQERLAKLQSEEKETDKMLAKVYEETMSLSREVHPDRLKSARLESAAVER